MGVRLPVCPVDKNKVLIFIKLKVVKYNQTNGSAKGTIFAPTYATLFLDYLEENLHTKIANIY